MAAFKEEVDHYLKRERFEVVDTDESLRFYQQAKDSGVVVAEGGVGRERAQRATKSLINRYRPDFMVFAGFAGGVQEGIKPGDLFVCDRLMSVEGPAALWRPDSAKELPPVDASVMERLSGIETARRFGFCACLSVPELVPSSSMKSWIATTFPVSIIDMESYWASESAASSGIPHLVVRCALDTVDQTLPAFVSETVGGPDSRRWRRAIAHILSRPGDAKTLVRLKSQVETAKESLGEFLSALVTALANPPSTAPDKG